MNKTNTDVVKDVTPLSPAERMAVVMVIFGLVIAMGIAIVMAMASTVAVGPAFG
jgi:hypothetical protein